MCLCYSFLQKRFASAISNSQSVLQLRAIADFRQECQAQLLALVFAASLHVLGKTCNFGFLWLWNTCFYFYSCLYFAAPAPHCLGLLPNFSGPTTFDIFPGLLLLPLKPIPRSQRPDSNSSSRVHICAFVHKPLGTSPTFIMTCKLCPISV